MPSDGDKRYLEGEKWSHDIRVENVGHICRARVHEALALADDTRVRDQDIDGGDATFCDVRNQLGEGVLRGDVEAEYGHPLGAVCLDKGRQLTRPTHRLYVPTGQSE